MELDTITTPKRVQFDPLQDFFGMIRIFVKKEKSEDGKTIVEVTETNECIHLREDYISVAMKRKIKDRISSDIGNPERSVTAVIKFYPVYELYMQDITLLINPHLPYEERPFESIDIGKTVFSVLEDIITRYFPGYLKYYLEVIQSEPMVEFIFTPLCRFSQLEYVHKTGQIVITGITFAGYPTDDKRNKKDIRMDYLVDLFFSHIYQFFTFELDLLIPPVDASEILINPDTTSHFVIDTLKLMNLLQTQLVDLWYNEPDMDKIKEKDIPKRIIHIIDNMLYDSLRVDETESDLHCVLNLPDSRVVLRMYNFSKLFSNGIDGIHMIGDDYTGFESKHTAIFPFARLKDGLYGISNRALVKKYCTDESGNLYKLTKLMQITIAVISNVLMKEYRVFNVDVLYYEIDEAWFYPESTTLELIDEKLSHYNIRIERVDLKHEINTFIPTIKTGEES